MAEQLDLLAYLEATEREQLAAPAFHGKRGRAFAAKRIRELNAHAEQLADDDAQECNAKHCPIHRPAKPRGNSWRR